MNWRIYLMGLFLINGIIGCNAFESASTDISLSAPQTLAEADLIGTWKDWNSPDSHEVLIMQPDYTFTQVYSSTISGYHFEGDGTWWLEYRPSGCVYLHLEGMRYFHLTEVAADQGNRHLDGSPIMFWEPCEEQVVTMLDKVILLVRSVGDFPRGIALELLMTERDRATRLFILDETVAE